MSLFATDGPAYQVRDALERIGGVRTVCAPAAAPIGLVIAARSVDVPLQV